MATAALNQNGCYGGTSSVKALMGLLPRLTNRPAASWRIVLVFMLAKRESSPENSGLKTQRKDTVLNCRLKVQKEKGEEEGFVSLGYVDRGHPLCLGSLLFYRLQ